MKRGAVVALLALTLVSGATPAAPVPTQGDGYPTWSADSALIAFVTDRGGHALAVVSADGSGERRLLERPFSSWAIATDWSRVATADGTALHLSRLDRTDERVIPVRGLYGGLSWSPDATQLAFTASDAVHIVRADGSGLRRLASGWDPAWSPDGLTIAFQAGPVRQGIHLISPNGEGERSLVARPGEQVRPVWSPDGARIAFTTLKGGDSVLGVARADGSAFRTYSVSFGGFAWAADGRSLLLSSDGLARLTLASGTMTQLTRKGIGWSPAASPDGRSFAFSGGGECRTRSGIYVIRTDGKQERRVTNDCHIVGTAGADTLRGTPLTDVLVGLGGDDRLYAVGADRYLDGDTLLGGPGDDVLSGAFSRDDLSGGPGDDRLYGGRLGDRLVGGPGRDLVHGQAGNDLIYARDGQRDTIVCGTNLSPQTPEHDVVVADPIDRVAADCEIVNGRKR